MRLLSAKTSYNPNHFDSEAHIESQPLLGLVHSRGCRQSASIMEETAEAKAANLPEQMIQNIANGRLNKFFKKNCLMEQEYHRHGAKMTVAQYLDSRVKD